MIKLLFSIGILGACAQEPKVIIQEVVKIKAVQPRSSLETALDLCIEDYDKRLPYKIEIIRQACKSEVLNYMRNAYPKKPMSREFKI